MAHVVPLPVVPRCITPVHRPTSDSVHDFDEEPETHLNEFIEVCAEEIRGVLARLVPKHRDALLEHLGHQASTNPASKTGLVNGCTNDIEVVQLPGAMEDAGSNRERGGPKQASWGSNRDSPKATHHSEGDDSWAPIVPLPSPPCKQDLQFLGREDREPCITAVAKADGKIHGVAEVWAQPAESQGGSKPTQDAAGRDSASAQPRGTFRQALSNHALNADTVTAQRSSAASARRESVKGTIKAAKNMIPGLKENRNSKGPPAGMFADMSAAKDQIRDVLYEREYDVANFYWKTGRSQFLARHQNFENITMAVIIMNIIYIAFDAEFNSNAELGKSPPVFMAFDHFFCTYYSGEIIIRFLAFEKKINFFKDRWSLFDSFLAITVVGETWVLAFMLATMEGLEGISGNGSILRILRLLRLTKVMRMVRILKLMPELLVLSKGLLVAFRSVFFTFLLLMVIVFIYVIAFKQLASGEPIGEEYFSSVPRGFVTLLIHATLPDFAELILEFAQDHVFYAAMLMSFIFLASLLVLNMLIGVLCEVVSFVSSVEKEQLQVSWVRGELKEILGKYKILADGQGKITRDDFTSLLTIPEAVKVIQMLGVDVLGLMDFQEFFFQGTDEIMFGDFMELVLQLRGSNKATVKDIVDLRRHLIVELGEMKDSMLNTEAFMGTLASAGSRGSSSGEPVHQKRRGADDVGLQGGLQMPVRGRPGGAEKEE